METPSVFINNEYKVLNDVLRVLSNHNTWIDIKELKTEMWISNVLSKGVQLELVLSKLFRDGYIESDIHKSRYTHNTEKHYRASFEGNVFLKSGGYLLEKISQIHTKKPIEVPENLKELLSIWHDKNDIENLVSICRQHELIFTNSTKKLISCFAHELYEKNWLTKFESNTFNPTDIARIFLKLADLKFNDAYNADFNFIKEKPRFNIKYSRNINIDMRTQS